LLLIRDNVEHFELTLLSSTEVLS